ncbi:MAG TPA: glycosyltransferase family 39 protein, partial [Thermoanaerobaculia bacterium]|nr:glycosyltransferase family 39 protein [Thermoanaerobaculia bacterium]
MARQTLLILTIFVVATTLLSPLTRDLFVGDETKYGQIIREMRESGSLLVPSLEGRPYTHKPPVHFWFIWALTFVFGTTSLWPFVIPSLVAYVALLWLAGRLAQRLLGGDPWLARFIVASFWMVWGLAQTARMDIEFTAAIAASALLLWRWLEEDRGAQLVGAGALAGLAVLIKGPMALVVLLILTVASCIRWKKGWRLEMLWAFLAAALIPLAWVVPAALAGGEEYSRELLVEQNVGRAVNAWTHSEPPWFYLTHFPVAFLPWSLIALAAIAAIWKRPGQERATRFLFDWFLAVLVPFSLLSSKLDVYMVPAMVPIGLLIARLLDVERDDAPGRWGIRLSRATVVLIGLIFLAAITIGPRFIEEQADRALVEVPLVRTLFWATAAMAAMALWVQRSARTLLQNGVLAGIVGLFPLAFAGALLMPTANAAVSSGPLVRALMKETVRSEEIGLYGTPHLWARDLPPSMNAPRYLGAGALASVDARSPRIIGVRRDKAPDLGAGLAQYELR